LCFTVLGVILLLPVTAASAQTASGASAPEQAVTSLLEPFYNPAAGSNACNAVTGQLADCPITARLRTRFEHATENGNIVSRSQNPPRGLAIKLIQDDGQTAHVATVWDYGSNSSSITFTVVKQDGGWQVDDSFCSADSASSIYNPPTGPCPFDTSGPTTPGMPNTGAGDSSVFVLLELLGASLTIAVGLVLLRVDARTRDAK
jgi:hypothetical protein